MSEKQTPVVLIGTRKSDGSLGAVGLYPDAGAAQQAIWEKSVPDDCYYSVMLPEMGQTIIPKVIELNHMTAPPSAIASENGR